MLSPVWWEAATNKIFYSPSRLGQFIQGLLAAPTKVNIDDSALPRRHIAVIIDLSWNNIIVITFNKSVCVVITDSTHINNKITVLLNDKNFSSHSTDTRLWSTESEQAKPVD